MAPATRQRRPASRVRRRTVSFTESASGRPESVDRTAKIIRGVRVTGPASDNLRRYLPEALERALTIYEGLKVKADHPKRPDEPRPISSTLGWLEHAHIGGDGAVYADLHYLESHPAAASLVESAERNPALFGLSHNADGKGYTDQDGVFVVEEITEIRSVDLVDSPATNRTLFEAKIMARKVSVKSFLEGKTLPLLVKFPNRKKALERILEENALDMPMKEEEGEDYRDHLYAAHKACSEGDPETGNKILGLLKTQPAEEEDALDMPVNPDKKDSVAEEEEEEEDKKDPDDKKDKKTEESRRGRKSADPAVKSLQEQVAKLRAEKDRNDLATWVREQCEAKRIGCDKALLEGLLAMRDRKTIGAHLDHLAKIIKPMPRPGPRSQAAGPVIESRDTPANAKEFAAALTRN